MAKPYIISALDIGSGSIKLLSVLKKPGEEGFEVIGQAEQFSSGIRKGVIIDTAKVAETIASLARTVEEDSGKKIEGVYASVGGGHLFSVSSRGLVSVSRADQKISGEDVERVHQVAQSTLALPRNKEIIEVFPKEYIVDGEGGIKEPIGMEGVRLEADVLVLCGFSPYIKNSSKTILDSGLQINELIPTPLASLRAVLTPREKELGVCVLDIGAGTTSMSVFEEGSLIYTIVFPIGSGHITNDIAVCLKTDIDTAEKIKLEYGTCSSFFTKQEKSAKKGKPSKKDLLTVLKMEGEEELVFSKKMLVDIIEARVSEMFVLVNKELKGISRQANLPAGIVLTGGGARIPGIKDLAKKELKLPCRIGSPVGFTDFQGNPSLSTLYGLILEGTNLEEERGISSNNRKGFGSLLRKIFGIFLP